MTRTTILSESRYGAKTVLIEQVHGQLETVYRVSVFRRFRSLQQAQAAFLAEVPPSAAKNHKAAIAEQVKRKHNSEP